MSGMTSHLKGHAAEEQVLRQYLAAGHRLLCRRWRGPGGEIDLVLEKQGELVFVEVKASATRARAAARLTGRQSARLLASAEAALGFFATGSLTPMRFDLAMVDTSGGLEILPNAVQAA
jgi:putative endonuclease